MYRRPAFTLIEALVVISIITLLLSLLLPNLNMATETAREVKCRVKLCSIMQAFQMFSDDQKGFIPAAWYEGPEMWQKAWAGKEVGASGTTGSHPGVLVNYIGGLVNIPEAYRCPSLPVGPWNTVASNGRFDYASFAGFSGARHSLISNVAYCTDPGTGAVSTWVTPIIVEEDPLLHINGCCMETGHGTSDEQGTWHRGGSNFAATDGSGHYQRFSKRGPNCFNWTVISPKGVTTTLAETGGWGSWNGR